MNMKKMTAVCVLLASGGLPHALADSSSGLPDQSVSSQMAASTFPDDEEEGEVGGDGEGGGEEVDPPVSAPDTTQLKAVVTEAEKYDVYPYMKEHTDLADTLMVKVGRGEGDVTQNILDETRVLLREIIKDIQFLEEESMLS